MTTRDRDNRNLSEVVAYQEARIEAFKDAICRLTLENAQLRSENETLQAIRAKHEELTELLEREIEILKA